MVKSLLYNKIPFFGASSKKILVLFYGLQNSSTISMAKIIVSALSRTPFLDLVFMQAVMYEKEFGTTLSLHDFEK